MTFAFPTTPVTTSPIDHVSFSISPRRDSPSTIHRISAPELKYVVTDLVDVFMATVNGGAPLGFMPPITRDESRNYWVSLMPDLESGSRILLVASVDNRIVGSAQLELSRRGNSPHRAEIQRVFVAKSMRGRGIGSALMHALHEVARSNGRTLLTLNTRWGEPPERMYRALGYEEVGVIPGWTIGEDGEFYDHVTLYIDLSA